jgi:hypothetical protein
MTRYIAPFILAIANCVGICNVVSLASNGRVAAAYWAAAGCTLGWIAVVLFIASAVLRTQRDKNAQARSSEDRATAS